MSAQVVMWVAFNVVVGLMLYVDLSLANKNHHSVGMKEAAIWSLVWVSVSLLFCVGIYFALSPKQAVDFLTGYLIEKSLSVDNMFVFIMIFSYFKIEPKHQPRILKWGILGALVMRFVLILAGTALLRLFHPLIYLFGAFLVYTGYKMAFQSEAQFNPERSPIYRLTKKFVPLTGFHGDNFFTVINGVRHATPLFLALGVVELSDLLFAVDSIPAILGITSDAFIVYTSNVFAILGLRALYFLLSGMVKAFLFLKYGVAVILAFVGVKMLSVDFFHVSNLTSLFVVMGILTLSVLVSIFVKERALN